MDFTNLNSGSSAAPLNLSKGSVLDLTKQAPALKKLYSRRRLGYGCCRTNC